jgi:hypothetical protein
MSKVTPVEVTKKKSTVKEKSSTLVDNHKEDNSDKINDKPAVCSTESKLVATEDRSDKSNDDIISQDSGAAITPEKSSLNDTCDNINEDIQKEETKAEENDNTTTPIVKEKPAVLVNDEAEAAITSPEIVSESTNTATEIVANNIKTKVDSSEDDKILVPPQLVP